MSSLAELASNFTFSGYEAVGKLFNLSEHSFLKIVITSPMRTVYYADSGGYPVTAQEVPAATQ